MALESVLAIAPPSIGAGNKDTQNAGDYQSDENAQDESFSTGDLEEGEILDSDGEAQENGEKPNCTIYVTNAEGKFVIGTIDPELEPGRIGKKKRKKKRKKKEDEEENEVDDDKPIKKKMKYIDHDCVNEDADEGVWFPNSPPPSYRRANMIDYHRNYDSPYKSPQSSSHRDHKSRSESPNSCQSMDENVNEFDNGPGNRRPSHPKMVKRRVLGRKQIVERGGLRKKKILRTTGMGLVDGKKKRRVLRMKGRQPPRKAACKFYLEGKCLKGNDCTFAHDTSPLKKKDLCKFFLNGYCAKGEKCMYMHNDFPCKFFHTGAECYSESNCKFSHDPLNEEMKKVLHRFLERSKFEEEQMEREMIRQREKEDDRRLREENSPPMQKRPSLLGSPPRHIKEAAETWEWQQQVLRMQRNKRSPRGEGRGKQRVPFIRPNFYVDTLSRSPVKQSGGYCDREPPEFHGQKFDFYDCSSDSPPRDCQTPIPTDEEEGNLSDDDRRDVDFDDSALWEEARSGVHSAESPPQETAAPEVPVPEVLSEALSPPSLVEPQPPLSPSPAVIPIHLPKRQRELFLRIQQHQKEVSARGESAGEEQDNKMEETVEEPVEPVAKEMPEKEEPEELEEEEEYDEKEEVKEKWYSSDEDDTEDQPLAEVLKKLQQMPLPPTRSQQSPAPPILSTPCQPIDISKMLNSIRQQASQPSPFSMKSEFWQNILATAAVPPTLPKPMDPLIRPQIAPSRDPRCRDAKPGLLSTPLEPPPQVLNRDPRTKVIPSNRDPRNLSRMSAPSVVEVKPTVTVEQPIEEKFWEVRVPSRTPNGKTSSMSCRLHTVTVLPRDYTPYLHATQNDLKLLGDPRLKKLLAQFPIPKTPILPFPPELQQSLEKLKEPEVTKTPLLEPLLKVPPTPGFVVRKTDPRLTRGLTQPANPVPSEPPPVPAALLNSAPPRFPRSVIDPRVARLHHPPEALRVPQKRPPKPKPLPKMDESEKPTFKPPPPPPPKKDDAILTEKDEMKGGSVNRKSSVDYASPLSLYAKSYEGSGYSSYNRRPQQRVPPTTSLADTVITLPATGTTTTITASTTTTTCALPAAVSGASQINIPSPVSRLLSSELSSPQDSIPGFHPNSPDADLINHASLKDVFKTIDPTASPFC